MNNPNTAQDAQKEAIWIALADLFFLDTQAPEEQFDATLRLLKEAYWDRDKTYKCLVEIIAPYGGPNLGNLIMPVIGEWAYFDPELVVKNCRNIERKREILPAWMFHFRDKHSKWMLKELDADRLLNRL